MLRKLFIITFAFIIFGGIGLNSLPLVIYLIQDALRSPQTESVSQEKNVEYLKEVGVPLVQEPSRLEQTPIIPLDQKRTSLEAAKPETIILKGNGIVSVEIGGSDSSSFAVLMVNHDSSTYLSMIMQGYLSDNT